MFADAPMQGVHTLFAQWGDWFGWLNVAILILLRVAAARDLKRKKAGTA
jgi:apolipoprotein N-acyltransferase